METASEKAPQKVDKDLLTLITSLPVWFVYSCIFFFAWIPLLIIIVRAWSSDGDLKTGEIGDTIGGLTAPIIGLLNAVFVYHAFKQQIRANEMQRQSLEEERERFFQQNEYSILLRLFERLESQINALATIKKDNRSNKKPFYGASTMNATLRSGLYSVLFRERDNLLPENKATLFKTEEEPSTPGIFKDTWHENLSFQLLLKIFQLECQTPLSRLTTAVKNQAINGHLYFEEIQQYNTLLNSLLLWAERLDRSPLSKVDKVTLVKNYMEFEYNRFFNLSNHVWLDEFLSDNDKIYKDIKNIEQRIKSIFARYKLADTEKEVIHG